MRRLLALLAVLLSLSAGCTSPEAPPVEGTPTPSATPVPSSVPAASTPAPTSPTAISSPPLPPPVPSSPTADPAPASGTPYDDALWEEPATPAASRITLSLPAPGTTRVEGSPGAVPARARLLVTELGAARGVLARADAEGAFSAQVPGGEGGWVQVALLPEDLPPGHNLLEQTTKAEHLRPSVYLRAPVSPFPGLRPGERAVAATGHVPFGAPWRFVGAVEDAGAEVRVRGVLRLASAADLPEFGVHGRATRAFDVRGEPLPDLGQFATSYLTPSGLPLERLTRQADPTLSEPDLCAATRESADTLRCDVDVRIPMAGLPPGGYVVRLYVPIPAPEGVGEGNMPADHIPTNGRQYDPVEEGVALTLLPRGVEGPFRLAALLLADAPAQAARGVQADGDAWGWNAGIAWQPSLHVTPRLDAAGAPIRYALDPYLPQVLLTDREAPAAPFFSLQTPGGTWTVTVEDPDGGTRTLGPAPFAALASRTATTRGLQPADNGGYNVDGLARLATEGDALRHAFARDGLHTVRVEGSARDVDGNAFRVNGTFRVLVAQPLDLDLGMLPGTPLAVGQALDRAVQVHPPVAANVTYRFREWTGPDATLTMDDTTTGAASAFGWFHPHAGHPVAPSAPGEYRVDVTATRADAAGRLWAGTLTFGGVVVDPASALEVHGRRGVDLGFQDMERFLRRDTGTPVGGSHMNFPYRSGDVAWQTDDDAMDVAATLADPDGTLAPFFASRAAQVTKVFAAADPAGGLAQARGQDAVAPRFAQGQGPLFSTTATGRDAAFGDPLDRFGYFYAAVEKPGVRVREAAREDFWHRPYWRFEGDAYGLQPGMGPAGDAPNDYKLLFAGAVVRAPGEKVARTGAYASLWVDVARDDPQGSRIDSPFRPGASPLFRVGGSEVRAAFDPTSVRPGSLLVEGDVADFGGYVLPLGPHRVFLNVTSPSGKVRSLSGAANPWGHLHEPAMSLVADEPGVWTVDVHARACPPAADAAWPCLEGGLDDGRTQYSFYVASRGAPPLPLAAPAFLPRGGALALRDQGILPGGHATAWMPGWTLDARALAAGDPLVRYEPAALARRFPNFETSGFQPGVPAEQVTFTALAPVADGTWRGAALDAWGGRLLPGG